MTRLHDDEVPVDDALVRRLVDDQFPELSALPIEKIDSDGTDNAVFRLGEVLCLRIPILPAAAARLAKEHEWLPILGPHLPLAVPEPVARGSATEEMPFDWSVYRWIEGKTATPGRLADPTAAAVALGEFVAAIHAIDPSGGPGPGEHNSHRGVPLVDCDEFTRRSIEWLRREGDVSALTEAWERALDVPVWDRPGVWIHGDLWETNLLLDADGALSAVIDFGCLGVGDPATDLTVAWNLFDAPTRQVFRDHAEVDDATWDRGRGWALLLAVGALPYYIDTNPVIVANGRRVMAAVLGD